MGHVGQKTIMANKITIDVHDLKQIEQILQFVISMDDKELQIITLEGVLDKLKDWTSINE